jgi:hypothetical protein
MKKVFFALIFLSSLTALAQKDCIYSVAPTKENKDYKATTDYLMYEKVFGNSSTFVFFSLANSEGVPLLNFQLLSKSKDFPEAHCFDKASRIYLQLLNGKIITLMNAFEDQCSNLVYDEKEKNNIRVLTSSFLFTKGSLEELEKSPIAIMRIKYSTEVIDYPVKKELSSETITGKFQPESYFINHLNCIE